MSLGRCAPDFQILDLGGVRSNSSHSSFSGRDSRAEGSKSGSNHSEVRDVVVDLRSIWEALATISGYFMGQKRDFYFFQKFSTQWLQIWEPPVKPNKHLFSYILTSNVQNIEKYQKIQKNSVSGLSRHQIPFH